MAGSNIISFILVLLASVSTSLCAQKVEREKRIPAEAFPPLSSSYLDVHFSGRSHEKLFLQTGSSGLAYEAKFRFEERQFSILFSESGQWIDTEKEIREDELPKHVKDNIMLLLALRYDKFILKRIQEQEFVLGKGYEIELKGKSKGEMILYEYLFDSEGNYIRHETIILEAYTNEF